MTNTVELRYLINAVLAGDFDGLEVRRRKGLWCVAVRNCGESERRKWFKAVSLTEARKKLRIHLEKRGK